MGSSLMDKLEEYSSIEELRESFEIDRIIKTQNDFEEYVNGFARCDENYFRGVCTAKYKMYNSAQRFYCWHKNDLHGITYDKFLSSLYKISSHLDNEYLKVLYDRQFNCIRYENNCKQIGYNPIWAYSALQHITQCAPLIDFTSSLTVALFFATNDSSSNNCTTNPLDRYFAIISYNVSDTKNNYANGNTVSDGSIEYLPLAEYLFDKENVSDKTVSEAVSAIEKCNMTNLPSGRILYITYNSRTALYGGRGIMYHISFENDNIVRQQGKLLINNSEDKPFESLWNNVFPWHKLTITLIDKSLRKTICTYLTEHCICHKTMLPIEKNYGDEIIKLIQTLV